MAKIYKPSKIPSVADYVDGLTAIKSLMSESQLRLLQEQYLAQNHTAAATELAELANIKGGRTTVNLLYGRLGRMFCESTGYEPDAREVGTHRWWSVWSSGYEERNPYRFFWQMHPEVVEALEILGWVSLKVSQELSAHSLYEQILSEMIYERDDRSPPDKRRRAQFKIGWENATFQRRPYTDETLNTVLTWNNLGYRFGKKLGIESEVDINSVYEFLAKHYLENTENLGIVNSANNFPDEVISTELFREGAVSRVLVNAYERDSKARDKCIKHYGTSCSVCSFNFGNKFGALGEGFIHVHHLKPISEIGQEYKINPIEDMRPVCPNCHAMIHRQNPLLSIEEIQSLLQKSDFYKAD